MEVKQIDCSKGMTTNTGVQFVWMDVVRLFLFSTFYVGIGSVFVAEFYIPQLLKYGKTWQASNDFLLNLTVSKRRFTDFYVISCTLALINLLTSPNLLTCCILIHSARRLFECCFVTTWGTSRIHVSHYIVGLWFYTILNVGVWMDNGETQLPIFSLILFVVSSIDQATNHYYLSKLQKYSRPTHGLFEYVCCAHYLDEILIYVSFAMMNQGPRAVLLHCIIWILVNLGASSVETGKWYVQNFGQRSKWYMIPGVF